MQNESSIDTFDFVLEDCIAALKQRKQEHVSRKTYIERLARMKSTVPELKSLFDQNTQSAIISAVEEHAENERIVLSTGDVQLVELNLGTAESIEDSDSDLSFAGPDNTHTTAFNRIDLDFLSEQV